MFGSESNGHKGHEKVTNRHERGLTERVIAKFNRQRFYIIDRVLLS